MAGRTHDTHPPLTASPIASGSRPRTSAHATPARTRRRQEEERMPETTDMSRPGGEPPKAPIERRHLGGTERLRPGQEAKSRPPVSRLEPSKAPAELIEEPAQGQLARLRHLLGRHRRLLPGPCSRPGRRRHHAGHAGLDRGDPRPVYVLTVTAVIVSFSGSRCPSRAPSGSARRLPAAVQALHLGGHAVRRRCGHRHALLLRRRTSAHTRLRRRARARQPRPPRTPWSGPLFHYGVAGWAMYSLLGMAMGYFAYPAGACRCPSGPPCTPCSASASAAGSATPSTSSPWSAPSSASPPPWASASCC
ncbi:hypothetical protein SHIRM173S_06379 [Streptomyces hirsutus]